MIAEYEQQDRINDCYEDGSYCIVDGDHNMVENDEITFKELRQQSGMNLKGFGEYFEIPYRTIQNWENGQRQCPEYLLKLMQYKLEKEQG